MKQTQANLTDVALGEHCTVLLGSQNGKYPDANGMIVRGTERTALIDPALGVVARKSQMPPIDLVLLSHCHEDHFAGLVDYPDADCWIHESEQICLRSLDDLLDRFGVQETWRDETAKECLETYNYVPRPDAKGFVDGHVWDLGGVTLRAIHAPGHTIGHCLFHIDPDDVLFLADIDLSSFGPFYGDVGSSIDDFERTIKLARNIKAAHYVSGHHKGIVNREEFADLIDRYANVIPSRESRLLKFLDQPRTFDQIVQHRFIYRPGDPIPGGDWVERVGMKMHLERLLQMAKITKLSDGTFHHFKN